MRLNLITVGGLKRGIFKSACEDFQSRLGHYGRYQLIEVKGVPVKAKSNASDVKAKEASMIRQRIPPGAITIALDEHGESWTTTTLAGFIEKGRVQGQREVVFVIGGPLGLDPAFLKSCDRRLALSAFTLPHDLARLILLEQLYRACTVIAGEPYHNP